MDRAVQEAEQRVRAAAAGGSETERQAAVQHLQQTQAAHAERLKQIAARLQEQLAVLQELKKP